MIEVRIAAASRNGMQRYVGRIGEVTGFSGQFVKVRFEGSDIDHLFLPIELKQF